jgi:hypothetical protein
MKKFSSLFIPLDSRSLSIFRIILGLVLVLDLFVFRINFIAAFYLESGIVDAATAKLIANSDSYTALAPLSILYSFKSTAFVWAFFILAAVPYFLFMLGYRSRLMGVLSLFFLWNIQHRTTMVIETDDRMLLVLLFWSIFLPLDNHLALRKKSEQVSVAASWAFLVQIFLIYFCNAFPKTGDAWHDGSALMLAMNDDLWVNQGAAEWLTQFPKVCAFISHATIPLEMFLAFSILIPFTFGSKLRLFSALTMIVFHWGINVFLSFGFLPLIASAWAIAIIPGGFWAKFGWKDDVIDSFPPKKWTIWGLLIILVFSWQAMTTFPWVVKLPSVLPTTLSRTSLTVQKWILYAPNVSSNVSWPQLKGVKKDNSAIEVRSGNNWDENGTNTKVYQYECWQNFVQYLMYNQPYSDLVYNRWLNWECRNAKKNNLDLFYIQPYRFNRNINKDGSSSVSIQKGSAYICP